MGLTSSARLRYRCPSKNNSKLAWEQIPSLREPALLDPGTNNTRFMQCRMDFVHAYASCEKGRKNNAYSAG